MQLQMQIEIQEGDNIACCREKLPNIALRLYHSHFYSLWSVHFYSPSQFNALHWTQRTQCTSVEGGVASHSSMHSALHCTHFNQHRTLHSAQQCSCWGEGASYSSHFTLHIAQFTHFTFHSAQSTAAHYTAAEVKVHAERISLQPAPDCSQTQNLLHLFFLQA